MKLTNLCHTIHLNLEQKYPDPLSNDSELLISRGRDLLETLWEKKKILMTNILSISTIYSIVTGDRSFKHGCFLI